MEKRILLITAATPPASGSHATRITAIVEGFRAAGASVTVLTCPLSSEKKVHSVLYGRISKAASIIETSGGIVRSAATIVGAASKSAGFLGRYIQRLRVLVRRMMLPDTFVSWIPSAVRAGVKHVKASGADAIVSSGAPFSAHIAGFLVSKISGAPLVLDYGDPWVFEPGRPRAGIRLAVERFLEVRILRHSKLASLTTQPTIDLYRARFGAAQSRYHLFPMGFDRSDYPEGCTHSQTRQGKITFVYAGRINEEYRTLNGLLDLLNFELANATDRNVEFVFYGSELAPLTSVLAPYTQSGLVRYGGNLDHDSYIQALLEADGLLIFGNNNSIQIPGKIAHYLPARKPILYFCNIPNVSADPALALLKRVQLTQVYLGGSVATYTDFRAACSDRLAPVVNHSELAALDWKVLAQGFADAALSATAHR